MKITICRAENDFAKLNIKKGDRCVKLTRYDGMFTLIPCAVAVMMPAYQHMKVKCETCGKTFELYELHEGRWCDECLYEDLGEEYQYEG